MNPTRWSPSEASLLVSLRTQFPRYTWEELASLFNSYTPDDRQRSSDGLQKKWRSLRQYVLCLIRRVCGHPLWGPGDFGV